MPDHRVVVVGTTTDYIDLIARRFPGRALFLTEAHERATGYEPPPDERSEILCDLMQPEAVLATLYDHLKQWSIEPIGIACFDCETLSLAAFLAEKLSLPFVSAEAVRSARSKFISKSQWRQAGVACPQAGLVASSAEAAAFLEKVDRPIVLKPLTGSGSELVFLCSSSDDCRQAVEIMKTRLESHPNARMYSRQTGSDGSNARQVFVAEEYIRGTEYSCDFMVDGGRVEVIRMARKFPAADSPLGTILAYFLPAELPSEIDRLAFQRQLQAGAGALGITHSLCMLDFIVSDGMAYMIELTPRIGGDCLPPLIRHSCGLDMLGTVLDFAAGKALAVPEVSRWRPLVGVRLFAAQAGIITAIDDHRLQEDHRVCEVYLKRRPGHQVVLPPQDYESRLLGHVIIQPLRLNDIAGEAAEIAAKLIVKMDTRKWTRLTTF